MREYSLYDMMRRNFTNKNDYFRLSNAGQGDAYYIVKVSPHTIEGRSGYLIQFIDRSKEVQFNR